MASDVSGVDSPSTLVTNTSSNSTRTKTVSPETAPRADVERDSVEITDIAARLRRLESALESQPVVDRAKVEALRVAIAEGRYRVDSAEVADKLLDLEASIEKD